MSAGEPVNWETLPDWFMIRDPEDISWYAHLLDQWIPATLVGPTTWVLTDSTNDAEILRALENGETIATTGPLIRFTVNNRGPGTNLYSDFSDIEPTPTINIELVNPGDIDRIAMFGSGGVELSSWKPSSPPEHHPISLSDWVLIAATGQDDWAVTGPIWLGRP